jgi:hypothetical protein
MKTAFFVLNDKSRMLIRFILAAGFMALAFYQFYFVSIHTITLKVIAFAAVSIAYVLYGVATYRRWRGN